MKKVTYTEEQIQTIRSLLDEITIVGVYNAKLISVIAQNLDNCKIEDEKEGEG